MTPQADFLAAICAAPADDLPAYRDFGTIEGTLELVSTHERDSCAIWEMLTNYRVDCFVTTEQLEIAKSALRKRVAITGETKYKDGRPLSIVVENIRVLKDDGELPQASDLGPVDITGGMSSEDYVRTMRDAE